MASTDASPFQAVGFALSSLGFAVAGAFRERLAPLGLEPKDFALLRAVGAAEGSSQNAVGEQLGIPASRMVALVDGLEERGLIERRRHPGDRRMHALHLTEAGRELTGEAFSAAIAFERELCAGLSEAERGRLLELLAAVREQLGIPAGVHAAQLAPGPG